MTELDLKALRQSAEKILGLREKATKGPWRYQLHDGGDTGDLPYDNHDVQSLLQDGHVGGCWWNVATIRHDVDGPDQPDADNAAFIASIHQACDTLAAMLPLIERCERLEAANEALLWMADEKNWIEPEEQALIKRADGTGGKQFGIVLVSAGLKPWVFAAQHAAMKHTEPDGSQPQQE